MSFQASAHWDRLALRHIANDLRSAQRILAAGALTEANLHAGATVSDGQEAVRVWAEIREDALGPVRAFVDEVEFGGVPTIGKLTLASSQVQRLARESR